MFFLAHYSNFTMLISDEWNFSFLKSVDFLENEIKQGMYFKRVLLVFIHRIIVLV
jgi:hypothetical protein